MRYYRDVNNRKQWNWVPYPHAQKLIKKEEKKASTLLLKKQTSNQSKMNNRSQLEVACVFND